MTCHSTKPFLSAEVVLTSPRAVSRNRNGFSKIPMSLFYAYICSAAKAVEAGCRIPSRPARAEKIGESQKRSKLIHTLYRCNERKEGPVHFLNYTREHFKYLFIRDWVGRHRHELVQCDVEIMVHDHS